MFLPIPMQTLGLHMVIFLDSLWMHPCKLCPELLILSFFSSLYKTIDKTFLIICVICLIYHNIPCSSQLGKQY